MAKMKKNGRKKNKILFPGGKNFTEFANLNIANRKADTVSDKKPEVKVQTVKRN